MLMSAFCDNPLTELFSAEDTNPPMISVPDDILSLARHHKTSLSVSLDNREH